MTYADTPVYSSAPVPAALPRRLRRALARRWLSGPLMAVGALALIVALIGQSFPLGAAGLLVLALGLRWTGEPLQAWVDLGPLGWFS